MGRLDGVILEFQESMSGFVGLGEQDPGSGYERGQRDNTPIRFDVRITIDDLGRFLRDPNHAAQLSGTVAFAPLGGEFPIRDGVFNLFSVDPDSGERRMIYRFCFTGADGAAYFLNGHKEVRDDPGEVDVVSDMTRLFTTIHRGEDDQGPVYAAGELRFKLRDAPALAASIKVRGDASWSQRVAARIAFLSFAYGALRDEYLRDIRPLYDTQYENLVLAGKLLSEDGHPPFFLVSGTHDKGFPWGDGELFWDLLLAVEDGNGGYRRYAITDRVLDGLELDLAGGAYRYRGPLYALTDGYAASFSQMRASAEGLVECEADIEIAFDAQEFDPIAFPFPVSGKLVRRLSRRMRKAFRQLLPGEHPLGFHVTPHSLSPRSGRLRITCAAQPDRGGEWRMEASQTFGEGERGSFRNLKEPTLLYGYLCSMDPDRRASRVQILTRTLRDEREHWAKDRLDAFFGTLVSRNASAEVLIEQGRLSVKPLAPAGLPRDRAQPLRKLGEPVVEVNNDHFPTAVFQRRIVEVEDPAGGRCLALEEDMSRMRLEAIDSDQQVTVAAIRDADRFQALDQVLAETGFDELIEERLAATGKSRAEFSVVIKPNFMFSYNKRDRATYTDPELVHHLVRRLRSLGFQNISIVEAQSTYGEYFDKRSVREMADYLGYDGSVGYTVVDMSEDATEKRHLGPHLGMHPVSQAWANADCRISFAKNKTHAYAYYTLNLKNIYGALPLKNKFKEYHCARDIYHTAIEYLSAFPVDYGLVDAYLSSDGPFGVFADPAPNETQTIIGGADLVAVDWVAATKMGIDPMISKYMKLAVKAFGKPAIRLVGDANPYRPWLNVPVALTLFTHRGLDANYHFGNLMYTISAEMDESHFRHKDNRWHIRLLRRLTLPIRRTFFLRTGENPSRTNRAVSWLLYRMGF